jgi:hypothetical protein
LYSKCEGKSEYLVAAAVFIEYEAGPEEQLPMHNSVKVGKLFKSVAFKENVDAFCDTCRLFLCSSIKSSM